MSTKEMIYQLINDFSEDQLKDLLTMLQSLKSIISDAEDDAYCAKLYEEYKNDTSSDKNDSMSIEDFANELGISLG